jgi:hypothetical protein
MRPYFTWLIFATSATYACWQLLSSDAHLPPILAGALLFFTGALAGLRWGADSAAQLIADLSRTNRYLAEQNDDLSELNETLLERIADATGVQRLEEKTPHSTE